MANTSIAERLRAIKDAYGSVDYMIERLKSQNVNVHRTTLYRWLDPESRSTPRGKAELVARILEGILRPEELTLRVAEPDTILALPSTIACKSPPMSRGTPRASAVTGEAYLKDFGVTPTYFLKPTGGETLEMLAAGEADVAIAAAELVRDAADREPVRCARLCNLSRAPLIAIALEGRKAEFAGVDDLAKKGVIVGFPLNSGVPILLDRLQEVHALRNVRRRGARSSEAAADDLRREEVHLFVAWDAYIRQVLDRLQAFEVKASPVLERMLGYLYQDIAVNMETANPAAIRGYLRCLLDLIPRLKDDDKFRRDVKNRLEISFDRHAARKATSYQLRDFDLGTLLEIWGKEVKDLGSSLGLAQFGGGGGLRR
jgi:hypothetical protein